MALENSNPTENEKLYIEDDEKEQEAHPLNTADSLILENLDVPEETRSEREPGRGGRGDPTGAEDVCGAHRDQVQRLCGSGIRDPR